MPAKRKSKKKTKQVSKHYGSDPLAKRWIEVLLMSLGAFSVLLLMSLISYHASDPGIIHAGHTNEIENMAGRFGAGLADITLTFLGFFAFLLPPLLLILAWNIGKNRFTASNNTSHYSFAGMQVLGFLTSLLSSTVLAHFLLQSYAMEKPFLPGGLLGSVLALGLTQIFNVFGSVLVSGFLWLCGLTLLTGISWLKCIDWVGSTVMSGLGSGMHTLHNGMRGVTEKVRHVKLPERRKKKVRTPADAPIKERLPVLEESAGPFAVSEATQTVKTVTAEPALTPPLNSKKGKAYRLPKLQWLESTPASKGKKLSAQQVESLSRDVEGHLKDFNIKADVVGVYPGPVVTRFELSLAAGTKVSKVTAVSKDLARSLSVMSVRVVETIPGKPVIGLEIPNENREMVRLRQIIASKEYADEPSYLPLALGKDIAGIPVVTDLAKMPHCLVAGTTGSGKSVGINAMIIGLLYRSTPKQLRMILIDPKMLELSIYDGIPHLLTPVVTDMKNAGKALRWCVYEMERRYKLMASLGVRNIAGYNALIETAFQAGNPLSDPLWVEKPESEEKAPLLETMPNIVICADEFADMIMVVGKKVEELITRLAQKARAAGIHLILATQRPSVDVITGLIKANIPTRVAFQVSSKIDSRTVLDQHGAEQLLGNGDMLYLPPGTGVTIRVHGAYVSDKELRQITDDIKSQGQPDYLTEITSFSDEGDESTGGAGSADGGADNAEKDALYDQAVQIVIESKRASISNIQRRLKIGYNRAARIVDAMEASGLVTPMDKNGAREVNANSYENS